MRFSRLIFQTRREFPADLSLVSDQLLVKSGFIRQGENGNYVVLPLGVKSLANITRVILQELGKTGSLEIKMPLLQSRGEQRFSGKDAPSEISGYSGQEFIPVLSNIKNPYAAQAADLAMAEIRSYRKLPAILHQIHTSEPSGSHNNKRLAFALEQERTDCFGFSVREDDLVLTTQMIRDAFMRIYQSLKLPVISITGTSAFTSGLPSEEFIYPFIEGRQTYLSCPSCGYTANQQAASFFKLPNRQQAQLPIEKIATPGVKTIKALADFLNITASETAKAVFLVASIEDGINPVEDKFVFVVVRGDMEVNENKLAHLLKAVSLRPATEDEIRAVGATPGYASPVGLKDVLTVVDDCIPQSPNLVAGANKEGFHIRNVNYGRDFQADLTTDIVLAGDGDLCPNCKSSMKAEKGILVGKIYDNGELPEATCLDEKGSNKPLRMCSAELNAGRLLSCIIQEHHEQFGMCLPVSAAPYPVSLIVLEDKSGQVKPVADSLEKQFSEAGIEILVDDRQESPGVKYMDSDLIGIPLRLTVSERSLQQGGIEFKHRTERDRQVIPLENVIYLVQDELRK